MLLMYNKDNFFNQFSIYTMLIYYNYKRINHFKYNSVSLILKCRYLVRGKQ